MIHGRLEVRWIFSQQCHKRNTVEALANAFMENLNAIISHCLSPQAGGFTPSDFPLAGLNDKKLEKIANLLFGTQNLRIDGSIWPPGTS